MKKLILLLLINFIYSFHFSQNGVYMVTEVIAMSQQIIYDSIYVTDPSGQTTGQLIPNLNNVSGHNNALNIILNGITSQGFKIIDRQGHTMGWMDPSTNYSMFYNTWLLAEP